MVSKYTGSPVHRIPFTVQELRDHFNKAGTTIASYFYLYLWIPIVNNAPWFPLCVIATDNKFNAGLLWNMWQKFHGAAKKEGLHLCGHCSDGDARLRKTDFRMNVEDNSSVLPESWRLAHHMLLLHILKTVEGLCILGFQDWMHLLWRLWLQLLDPKRVLTPGAGQRAARAHLVDAPHLLTGDLDPSDKQNCRAVERIFSVGRGDNTFFSGTFAYIMLGMRLKDAWLADTQREGPRQCVKDASFVHCFILFWRWWIATSTPGETLAIHFITCETFLDVVTSAGSAIYRSPLFRDHYPNDAPVGNRFASRLDEDFFQFSRMRQKNAPSFGVKGFLTHVRHYTCQQFLVAEGQWETPSSKPGAPHRLLPHSNAIPLNFTDADLMSWVNEGLNEAMLLWMNELGVRDIMVATNPEEFYVKPIKHFPWHEAYKDPSFQEVRNKTNDESDEPIDVDVHYEEDNQEAAMLIDHLVRLAPGRQGAAPPLANGDPFNALLENIGPLIVDLNASIKKEAYERKYRFKV